MRTTKIIITTIGLINAFIMVLLAFFYMADFGAILTNSTQTDGSLLAEAYFANLYLFIPLSFASIMAIRWSKLSMAIIIYSIRLLEQVPLPRFLK
ncbi:hypothetical protein JXE04_02060 [Patescibacteria group bacterium]|nr:hypothetical protein [Patescibacteria group bacterium]